MEKASKYYPIRRSTRLPLEIPLRITSLDPKIQFSEPGTTATVNAHGCGVISAKPVASGTRVQLEIVSDAQRANARVLDVVPLNDEKTSWLLGMEMEQAGNFWGIKYAPADWSDEEPTHGVAPAPEPQLQPVVDQPVVTENKKPAPASQETPTKLPTPSKEVASSVLRKLRSECRLAAISTGGCYVQTGTTFPAHAPVQVTVHAGGEGHSFSGVVRVEHVGSGMGIEFTDSADTHARRISNVIEALSESEGKVPEVSVALSAPPKEAKARSAARVKSSQYDALLALILVGTALKRSDFLRELEKQRRRG